jgi:hypothetical protein
MKRTPRNLLLERHRSVEARLDERRRQFVAGLLLEADAGKRKQSGGIGLAGKLWVGGRHAHYPDVGGTATGKDGGACANPRGDGGP